MTLFIKKTLVVASLLVVSLACSSKKSPKDIDAVDSVASIEKPDSTSVEEVLLTPSAPEGELKNFTKADVAKFVMAAVMSQPVKIISVKQTGGIFAVSYTRRSDGQRFEYKVKFEDNKAVWANIDGRWREDPEDERITFSEMGKKLSILQTFSDGSVDSQEFSK